MKRIGFAMLAANDNSQLFTLAELARLTRHDRRAIAKTRGRYGR